MIPAEARTWWHSLSDDARQELERSWHRHALSFDSEEREFPITLVEDVEPDPPEDVYLGLLEYIINHEMRFVQPRRFHISGC